MLDLFDEHELPDEPKNDRLRQAQGDNPAPWTPLVVGKGFVDAAVDRITEAAVRNPRMVTHIASEASNRYNRTGNSIIGSGGTPPSVRRITKDEVEAVIRDGETGVRPL